MMTEIRSATSSLLVFFFFQAEDGIRDDLVTGVQTCALPILYNYMPEQAKKKGAPVDWFALEPAVARSNAIGIARRAPHPNAALLFYDYMITEAQQYFVSLDYVPTNTSVSSPLKSLRFQLVDPVQALDQMDNWTQVFQEVAVRRAGP